MINIKPPMYMARIDCYECKHHQKMKAYEEHKNMYSGWCKDKRIRLRGTYSFPRECKQFIKKDQQLLKLGDD